MKYILCKYNLRNAWQFVINGGMDTTPLTVFDPNDLADVRAKALAELEQQALVFSRTAGEPIERGVQAELAEELRNLRVRWQLKGLIKLSPEAQAATAATAA